MRETDFGRESYGRPKLAQPSSFPAELGQKSPAKGGHLGLTQPIPAELGHTQLIPADLGHTQLEVAIGRAGPGQNRAGFFGPQF